MQNTERTTQSAELSITFKFYQLNSINYLKIIKAYIKICTGTGPEREAAQLIPPKIFRHLVTEFD